MVKAMDCVLYLVLLLIIIAQLAYSDERPNIIVFVADDWGFNDVGWHYNTDTETPFLTSLATTESLIISSHYVTPECTPTRASLLTGRYHTRYGLQENIGAASPYGVSLTETLISNEFKNNGYTTHAIGKWHLGFSSWDYTPTFRGFNTWSGYYQSEEDYWTHICSDGEVSGYDLRINEMPAKDFDNYYGVHWQRDQLFALLNDLEDTNNEIDPFFIYVAWQSSHIPSQAPDKYMNKYLDSDNDARRAFQAQTTLLDDTMNQVITELKDSNLWDNTLIVFFSDNGAEQGFGDNSPLRGAKHTAWEGGVRVPAFVSGGYLNENQRGKTLNSVSMHVTDWYPTLLSAAKSASSKSLDGNDMWNVIQNNVIFDDDVHREFLLHIQPSDCEVDVCGAYIFSHFKLILGGTVVTKNAKQYTECFWSRNYAVSDDNDILGCGEIGSDFTYSCDCQSEACLYDLAVDPCEYNDISKEEKYSSIFNYMIQKLGAFNSTQVEPLGEHFTPQWNLVNPDNFDGYWTPFLGSISDSSNSDSNTISQSKFDFEAFLVKDIKDKIGHDEKYLQTAKGYRDEALKVAKKTSLYSATTDGIRETESKTNFESNLYVTNGEKTRKKSSVDRQIDRLNNFGLGSFTEKDNENIKHDKKHEDQKDENSGFWVTLIVGMASVLSIIAVIYVYIINPNLKTTETISLSERTPLVSKF